MTLKKDDVLLLNPLRIFENGLNKFVTIHDNKMVGCLCHTIFNGINSDVLNGLYSRIQRLEIITKPNAQNAPKP